MNFNLRAPCSECPFRRDIPTALTPDDAADLVALMHQHAFPCHQTVDYDHDDPADQLNEGTEHCAGAMIIQHKEQRLGRMQRLAALFDLHDPEQLDMNAPVYDSTQAFIEAQTPVPADAG